jgi:hypothetical protein
MRAIIDVKNQEDVVLDEVKRIDLWVTENKKYSLYFNQFGELEVNKQTYDSESSTIIIKPSVSNHINII